MTFIRVNTIEELMSERSWELLFELSFSSSLLSLSPLMFSHRFFFVRLSQAYTQHCVFFFNLLFTAIRIKSLDYKCRAVARKMVTPRWRQNKISNFGARKHQIAGSLHLDQCSLQCSTIVRSRKFNLIFPVMPYTWTCSWLGNDCESLFFILLIWCEK